MARALTRHITELLGTFVWPKQSLGYNSIKSTAAHLIARTITRQHRTRTPAMTSCLYLTFLFIPSHALIESRRR